MCPGLERKATAEVLQCYVFYESDKKFISIKN